MQVAVWFISMSYEAASKHGICLVTLQFINTEFYWHHKFTTQAAYSIQHGNQTLKRWWLRASASGTDQHHDTESDWLHCSSSIRAVDQHHNTEFWCTNRDQAIDQAIGTGGRHTNYIESASKCRIGSMTPQFINIWVADRHHSTEFLQYAPCKSNNLNLNWLCAPIKHAIYIPRAIVQWL